MKTHCRVLLKLALGLFNIISGIYSWIHRNMAFPGHFIMDSSAQQLPLPYYEDIGSSARAYGLML
jgi:hypothetical protein